MKALNGKGQPRPGPRGPEAQRKGLLAKIHIAKKELGLQDVEYREIIESRYGRISAGDLSNPELEDLVQYYIHCGWQPKPQTTNHRRRAKLQTEILRERAWAIASDLENGEKRLRGLVKKICGIERIEWCHDVPKLKRLLAALEKIAHS